jgi:hypothetical protein
MCVGINFSAKQVVLAVPVLTRRDDLSEKYKKSPEKASENGNRIRVEGWAGQRASRFTRKRSEPDGLEVFLHR